MKRVQGLRTGSIKSMVRVMLQQIIVQRLTHRDDISVCIIHSYIILLCPSQADFRPGPELLMCSPKSLPVSHKHLETGDRARQNWCRFGRHALLKCARNLSLHERLSMGQIDDSRSRPFLTLQGHTSQDSTVSNQRSHHANRFQKTEQ